MCVAAVAFLFAGHAVAGPCDEAERGTYLSNVCWLVEEFSEQTPTFLQQNLAVMAMSLAQNAGKRREDRVTVCGSLNRVDGFRVIRAVSNLYAKHCTGKEFRVLEESGHDDRNETYARRYDGRECSG